MKVLKRSVPKLAFAKEPTRIFILSVGDYFWLKKETEGSYIIQKGTNAGVGTGHMMRLPTALALKVAEAAKGTQDIPKTPFEPQTLDGVQDDLAEKVEAKLQGLAKLLLENSRFVWKNPRDVTSEVGKLAKEIHKLATEDKLTRVFRVANRNVEKDALQLLDKVGQSLEKLFKLPGTHTATIPRSQEKLRRDALNYDLQDFLLGQSDETYYYTEDLETVLHTLAIVLADIGIASLKTTSEAKEAQKFADRMENEAGWEEGLGL